MVFDQDKYDSAVARRDSCARLSARFLREGSDFLAREFAEDYARNEAEVAALLGVES